MFEPRMSDGVFQMICLDHDTPIRAEVLLRDVKIKTPRQGKRPAVKNATIMQVRCPMCKRFDDLNFAGLLDDVVDGENE